IAIINKCGGVKNVGTFDWGSCTGECAKTDCSQEWANLSERCGGDENIINWDGDKCTGACKTDDIPNVAEGDAAPATVKTTTTTNGDGTSTTSKTTTYNIDGTDYTTTTTTNYDSGGNVTGTSTTESQGDSEHSYPVPSSWYTKKYDIANGLSSYLDYHKLTSATSDLQGTAVYQVPNLLLQCLGYIQGDNCEYPPSLTVDFHNRFSSQPIVIDLSPFDTVVKTIKFFFALICIIGTAKLTMILFR
ncbi:MAG: hypothetical protein PHI97_33010, partial [Desulfobulbus sp.]|nr:hypothetical protein [Desulfobulbus sp.]